MSKKLFYLMSPPDSGIDTKAGITTLSKAHVRLGTYQNALGPRFKCNWQHCWVGDGGEIQRLEREVKKYYKKMILNEGAGYTEWISGIHWYEMITVVEEIIEGHRFKVESVPLEFLPLNSESLKFYRTQAG
jgi:hypothetical protein